MFVESDQTDDAAIEVYAEVDADVDQETAQAAALANENVLRFVEDKTIRKVILVPGKLLNIVVG